MSSYDGTLLATVVDEKEVHVRRLATGETIHRFGPLDDPFWSLAFSPDSSMLASGDHEGIITVWDLESGEEIATLQGHVGEIFSLCYSPDQSRLASGGNDGNVVLWDAETHERVMVLTGHASYVHSLRFSPDGTMIASASGDRTVRVWDSVLPSERWRQRRHDQALRRQAEPMVERLLDELGDPLDVADHLRSNEALEDDLRRAALRCLLARSVPRHESER